MDPETASVRLCPPVCGPVQTWALTCGDADAYGTRRTAPDTPGDFFSLITY